MADKNRKIGKKEGIGMCEFISWLKVKRNGEKHILYLDDQELFSERTREILKGSQDNDFMGHHAIRLVYNLKKGEGEEGECKDFWETNRLPEEIQPKLKDFQTFHKNFGKMVETHAQKDDLEYVVANASKEKQWKGLKEFCSNLLKDWLVRKATLETLSVNVRYDLSVEELVKANKFNGYVNPDVNDKNFPNKNRKAEKKEAVLLCLNGNASDEEVQKVMKRLKLIAGTPKEKLSLSLDHPDLQKKFPIVALGQSWRDPGGDRYVPYLDGWDGGRSLGLGCLEFDWGADCRFLAFRKSSRR